MERENSKNKKGKKGKKKKHKHKKDAIHALDSPQAIHLDFGHASDPGKRKGEFPYVPVGQRGDELED